MLVSLGGCLGLTVGRVEGIKLNFFGVVLALDIRRPALKLPGIGESAPVRLLDRLFDLFRKFR